MNETQSHKFCCACVQLLDYEGEKSKHIHITILLLLLQKKAHTTRQVMTPPSVARTLVKRKVSAVCDLRTFVLVAEGKSLSVKDSILGW